MKYALGLVETKGLVAAIEAADVMVKTAHVTLIGKEQTNPALITIKIVGDTAAVQAAVEAGAAAAARVGQLVSKHVIPRPAEGIEDLIYSEAVKKISDEDFIDDREDEGIPEEPYSMPEGLSPQMQKYYDKLNGMTVHELRSYARSVEGLSIHGREISRANKKQLLEELMRAKENE